ncbi:DUF6531 domain-containing protein [Embleya sp. NPDC059259]|uniref:DUF6531 domain-containing protein n=1 Tax=unclassified Embleya TaxID=2699296 RepID=UPI00367EBEFB
MSKKMKIPECPVATEMIPGDPVVLEALADTFGKYVSASANGSGRLKQLAQPGTWQGPAAEGFTDTMKKLPGTLDKAVKYFADTANALRTYAGVLRGAQAEVADQVIPAANEARARSAQWKADKQAVKDGTLVLDLPKDDVGKDQLEHAEEQYGRVHSRLKDAEEVCWKAIDKGRREAPTGGDPITAAFKSFGAGFKEGVQGLVTNLASLAKLSPAYAAADPDGYLTNLQSMAANYKQSFTDPVGYLKDSVNWDEWRKNPWKALGLTAPELILQLATGGGSKLVPGHVPGPDVKTPGGKGPDSKGPDHPGKPGDNKDSRPEECRTSCGDPVDVVTGDVLLSTTDLTLPGVLPLVLERRHISSHRRGRWFGPSWASTLDQRLELRADGVVYTSPKGLTLRYPVPRPGEEVLPGSGPRWPLSWDHTPGGGFAIRQPASGVILYFTPDTSGTPVIPLRAIYDRNLNRVEFHYDQDGNPVRIEHLGGYHVAVDTEAGRVRALHLLDGDTSTELVRYDYDEAGDLAGVVNSSGESQRFTYDDTHRLTSWTDRNGTWYEYCYDASGRCVRQVGKDGFLSGTFAYDGHVTRHTNSLGRTSSYEHNERYQVVREVDPLGNTVTQEWDAYNNLLSRTDALGRTTRLRYDALGNVTHVTRPDGLTSTIVYNGWCKPVEAIGVDGTAWRYEYDEAGNLLARTDPTGAVSQYAYHALGRLAGVVDALGNNTRVQCDLAGLPVTVKDASGAVTRMTRDAFGRPTEVIDPLGHVTRLGWTVEGKPAWRELPDGSRESWTWDGEGNLRAHRDRAGSLTRYESTCFDLTSSQTTSDGVRHAFAYDTELRLTKVTNPQGRVWTYEFDEAGRLIAETDFNGRTLYYAHDRAGHLVEKTNGAGEGVTYRRDALGLVVEQCHTATGRTTTYRYDSTGRLIQAANPDVELILQRDRLGRVLTESSNGRTLTNTYDAVGRRISRATPAGRTGTWTYNASGQPASLQSDDHELAFTYDAAGRETERRFGPAVAFLQEWDELFRLTTQTTRVGVPVDKIRATLSPELAAHDAHRRSYTYRSDGYVTSVDDTTTGLKTYSLDEIGRVTAVHADHWTERYAYDTAGNLTHGSWPGEDTDAQGDRDLSGSLITRAGRTHYEYDAQGRIIRQWRHTLSGKRKVWAYTFDAEDRLTELTVPGGTRWVYLYDPLARRTAKQRMAADGTVAEKTNFTWDGPRVVEEDADGRSLTWEYEPGTHRPLVQINGQAGFDDRFYAIVTDLVGTPSRLVTEDGATAWQAKTTLWGIDVAPQEGVGCPLAFPGQYRDAESELSQNWFRYFSPALGGFQTADPLGLVAGPTPHAYSLNPLYWIDPHGLQICEGTMALGITPHVEALVASIPGGYTFTGDQYRAVVGQVNGQPIGLWQSEVSNVLRNNGKVAVTLKDFDGDNPSDKFWKAYQAGGGSNWRATEWEMRQIGLQVQMENLDWSNITFYDDRGNVVNVPEPKW